MKDRIKHLTGSGADLVIDPVGGPLSEQTLRALRPGGTFVTVGYASGSIPAIPLNLVLLKGIQIRGMEMGGVLRREPGRDSAAMAELGRLVGEGLRPFVSATYPLDDVRAALEAISARAVLGKIVVVIRPDDVEAVRSEDANAVTS